jgi:hypothetical protein
MTKILTQLGHSTLLPQPLSAAILSGITPPMSDLIYHLLIGSMDAEAMTSGDPKSTWNERRIARQLLGLTFLAALLLEETFGPVHGGASAAATAREPMS